MATTLLEVRNLKKYYPVRNGLFSHSKLHAVDDVSFCLKCNETMGLVGESGCGKTTLGKCVLRLEEPTEGEVVLAGQNVTSASSDRLRQIRRSMQMVFQDPTGSLNPRMRVGRVVEEPLLVHRICGKSEVRQKTVELFRLVGLKEEHMGRYPHQLSGGQQQRVGIARALVISPRLVILDEPTSCLDVSVQAQLLALFKDLQERFNLSYIFISHDLSLVSVMADWTAVMYLGQIVELGPTLEVFSAGHHPYTKALLSAAAIGQTEGQEGRFMLHGEPTSAIDPGEGCRLAPRCPFAEDRCSQEKQALVETSGGYLVRCWKWDKVNTTGHRAQPMGPDMGEMR